MREDLQPQPEKPVVFGETERVAGIGGTDLRKRDAEMLVVQLVEQVGQHFTSSLFTAKVEPMAEVGERPATRATFVAQFVETDVVRDGAGSDCEQDG